MIGFGFMDNTIMIQAGELIDMSFGVKFGLSTLTAAAVGQLFSDASGVCFGSTVDNLVCRMFPKLQPGEIGKRITAAHLHTGSPYAARLKFLRTFSAVAGVMIGCCLGMTQLLFMDLKKAERLKALQQCRPLFVTLMEEGHELLNCQRCALYLKVDDTAGPVTDPNASDYDLWMAGMPSETNSISDSDEKLEARMRAWRTMDPDKDGYISTNDLAAVVTKMGYKPAVGQALNARNDNQVAEILASCDVKGDRINFEQFDRVMPKLIKLTNQDCRFSPKQRPLLEYVLRTGEVLRIDDVESPMLNKTGLKVDPDNMDRYRGVRTHSVLICPVIDPKTGSAIGVVECVNKYHSEAEDSSEIITSDHQQQQSSKKKARLDDEEIRKWRETCSTPSGDTEEQLEIINHALELSSANLDIDLKSDTFVAYPKPDTDDQHKYRYIQNCPPASLLEAGKRGEVKVLIICASAPRVNQVAKELEEDCGVDKSKIARVAFTGRGRRKEQKAAHDMAIKRSTICVTVPGRLSSISEYLGDVELVILDTFPDVKGLSLLSQQQTRDTLLDWLTSEITSDLRHRKGTQHLSTVNARIETVETSKIYSPHLKSRERCILVVDGFYEWSTKKDGNKIPYFIRFKNGFAEKPIPGGDGSNDDDDKASQKDDWPIDKQFWEDDRQTVREPLLMACLYAPPTTDDDPHSFTILTMDSVGPISKIHDRMPVSLTPEVAADWIDCTEASDSSLLHKIADNARHVALNDITVYEVPPLANNMRNDTPDCLLPLATWKKKQFDNGLGRFFKKQDSSTTKSKTSSSDTKEPSAKKARVEH
ncbi:hypothetical protein FOL47_002935 [Perkinsus chesapeaki]|uniref:EF-hand domain-containing protein n=1 Tax=Perkinsus chesapeaki TaxID=330153 RepID=A0A7J6MC66_PERCH|nr:hypothetical protein FOL47_002935 [Perkinsus chesapeaki]